jgi:hypothetical protein
MQATHDPAQIAAGTPSRRFDGKPETDADRRFFDLRESGYTGWIDQDGPAFVRTVPDAATPVATPAVTATVTAVITPAVTLRAAATYIDRYGWCQGGYYEQTGRGILPAACIVAAIGMVCYGHQVDAPAMNFEDPGWGDFEAAVAYLDRYLAARYGLDDNGLPVEAYSFNDTRGRTADQVTATLRAAADDWDAEQAPQTEPAEQPHTEEPTHADYPHEPGALYDCPACEAACFCTDGFQCVHHAIEAETADGDTTPGGVA